MVGLARVISVYGADDLRHRLFQRWRTDCVRPDLGLCWNWTGARDEDGYGLIRLTRVTQTPIRVHRLYAAMTGILDPSSDDLILHACDNPACFNPEHLFSGSARDNARDRVLKARNPGQKLTLEDVRSIRHLVRAGVPVREVARQYSVNPSHVWRIIINKQWSYRTLRVSRPRRIRMRPSRHHNHRLIPRLGSRIWRR